MSSLPSHGKPDARGHGSGAIAVAAGLLALAALSGQLVETYRFYAWVERANTLIPATVLVASAIVFFFRIRRGPESLFMPLPWFAVSCAVYFGIGASAKVFATAESNEFSSCLYRIDDVGVLRTNVLNAVALAIVFMTHALVALRLPELPPPRGTPNPWRLIIVLAVFTIPIKYGLLVPYELGLLSFVPPTSIAAFGSATRLVMFLLWDVTLGGRKRVFPLALAFTFVELAVALISHAKIEVLTVLFMVALAIYMHRPRISTIAACGSVAAVTYFLLVPYVTEARMVLSDRSDKGLSSRIEASLDATERHGSFAPDERQQGWWTRLDYTNAQAFAMDMYDRGSPGRTYEEIPQLFVPRFIWLDKPVVLYGAQFNRLATGTDTSSTAPGVFAEGYWNFGWPGVTFTCLYIGAILAILEKFASTFLRVRDFRWLPCGSYAVQLGLRPDHWFGPAYVVGLAVSFVYLVIILLLVPSNDSATRGAPA